MIIDRNKVNFIVKIEDPLEVGFHYFEELDSCGCDVFVDIMIRQNHRGLLALKNRKISIRFNKTLVLPHLMNIGITNILKYDH